MRKNYVSSKGVGVCAILAFVIVAGMSGCSKPQDKAPVVTAPKEPINSADMLNGRHYPGLSNYYALMNAGKYWEARNLTIVNQDASDPAMKPLIADAEVKSYLQTIDDPNTVKEQKQKALVRLASDYPDKLGTHAEAAKRAKRDLDKAAEAIAAADLRKFEAERKRLKAQEATEQRKLASEARKRGVYIGMTEDRVLMSSWGRPEHKNRTISSHGVREQWVYDGGNYLYFEDGILTSIQN